MFKFFLFLRHRDVESDILTAGIYKEEGAAIWKTFKDKAYRRSLVGVRKLREAAPNRLLEERHTAGYEEAYRRSQVSASRCTSLKVKASLMHVNILDQNVLPIRNTFSTLLINQRMTSYVYWTVHHLDSWVKRDQLDVTYFIISLYNAQYISDVNTPILRSLRLMCWVISWVTLIWFDVCWS